MKITEQIKINGRNYVRTHSDKNVMIHGGYPEADYSEAVDPEELGRIYTETNIPIDDETEAKEIVEILTGGEP